jgi:RNA polymerase sigma factor (sigma-70 family)
VGDQLTDRVRAGDIAAFTLLYLRYRNAASSYTRYFSRCAAEREDLVAEAFERILSALLRGKGPSDDTFLGYLATTIRHAAIDRSRWRRKEELTDEIEVSAVDADPMMLLIDRDVATGEVRDLVRALRGPEIRWQVVLLLLDVKRLPLATVAEVLRISPNAVSALACRARAGLRKAVGAA